MACHRVISETPEQPALSTVDTSEAENHSCWLSEWLSIVGHQFQVNRLVFFGAREFIARAIISAISDCRVKETTQKSSAGCLDPSPEARPLNPEGPFPAF